METKWDTKKFGIVYFTDQFEEFAKEHEFEIKDGSINLSSVISKSNFDSFIDEFIKTKVKELIELGTIEIRKLLGEHPLRHKICSKLPKIMNNILHNGLVFNMVCLINEQKVSSMQQILIQEIKKKIFRIIYWDYQDELYQNIQHKLWLFGYNNLYNP